MIGLSNSTLNPLKQDLQSESSRLKKRKKTNAIDLYPYNGVDSVLTRIVKV